MRRQGFTLIEIIVSLVLLGIIFSIGGMFFSTMVRGYTESRIGAATAQAAEITADRIVAELKDASGTIVTRDAGGSATATNAVSVQYQSTKSQLSGTRRIYLSGSALYLAVDGTDYLLLESVNSFDIDLDETDIDGNSADSEISRFDVTFTIQGIGGTFRAQITPRHFIRR